VSDEAQGPLRMNNDACDRSAFPLIAPIERTWRHFSFGPFADSHSAASSTLIRLLHSVQASSVGRTSKAERHSRGANGPGWHPPRAAI